MSQTEKRRNIATNTVIAATALWDAFTALQELALERAQAGNFEDADFAETDLIHLTPYLVGVTLDTLVPDLKTFLEANSRRDYLLQLRR